MKNLILLSIILLSFQAFAQKEGDVIINEIGNNGTKKALYTGGDYVELLVLGDNVKLAGWYLSDLSTPSGTAKDNEGSIKFSDGDKSVFNQELPRGTYVLILLGDKDGSYGAEQFQEDLKLDDGNNRIVVYAYSSPDNIVPGDGKIVFTGKDNIVLASDWNKKKAVDAVSWGGSCNWEGCTITQLPLESLDNGYIAYFKPEGTNFKDNSDVKNWVSTSDSKDATPGKVNKDVDDSSIKK
jgi:hypothetical protein